MKVLLDTNILLAITPKRSKVRGCYDALRAGAYTLVVSTEILEEYAEQLEDFYSELFAESVMEELLNLDNIEFSSIFYRWNLITADPDDNKFVDAAIASNADFIVTHDGHFRVLREIGFPNVVCLTLAEFEDALKTLKP